MAERRSREPAAVRRDFHAAIDRLGRGMPEDETLRAKAAAGRLRINKINVAREAGRAYALLFQPKYADVVDRIDQLRAIGMPVRPAPSSTETLRELRGNIRAQIEEAEQHWHTHVELRATVLERDAEIERYRREAVRLRSEVAALRDENARALRVRDVPDGS